MLKTLISSFTIAAISATGIIYARPAAITDTIQIKHTEYEVSTFAMATKISPTEYAIAGQSGQVITNATQTAVIQKLAVTPQNATVEKDTTVAQEASASADNLTAIIEPAVKPLVEPSPTPTPTLTPKPTQKPSPIPTLKPVQLPAHELDALFQKYGAEYGVSWEKLKAIAKCESGFNAAVVSKNGLYGGLFQYVASTWSGTRKQMGLDPNPDLRFNAEEAIRTTAYKISKGGIGAWPHCGKK